MILYSRHTFWRIIFTLYGSAVWVTSNIAIGVCVAILTGILAYGQLYYPEWVRFIAPTHNLGWTMMGNTVIFSVVFRTSLGWQRYWEALTNLQSMYSKWTDAYTQCLGFFNVTIMQLYEAGADDAQEKIQMLEHIQMRIRKNFSVLGAVAAHRLSHGDILRMDKRAEGAAWGDRIVLRRALRTGRDLTGATKMPSLVATGSKEEVNDDQDNSWTCGYCVLEVPNPVETEILKQSNDRVNTVLYWITHDFALVNGFLAAAPPIQSRMYQELSTGSLAFSNAVKVADVPFPFQFAQLFNILLIIFSIFIPLYASIFTQSLLISPLLAFVVHQTLFVINKVAMELETPFGVDANDLSLKDFHSRYMEGLIECEHMSKFRAVLPLREEKQTVLSDETTANATTINGCLRAGELLPIRRSVFVPKVARSPDSQE